MQGARLSLQVLSYQQSGTKNRRIEREHEHEEEEDRGLQDHRQRDYGRENQQSTIKP